jgi:hypothetical protein
MNLIIQEAGRNKENKLFREGLSIKTALESLGLEAEIWGKGYPNYKNDIDYDSYNCIINIENYDTGWVPNLSTSKAKKILWVIDAHCAGEQGYLNEFNRGDYDLMFHATEDFCNEDFKIWVPNSFDDELIKKIDSPKKHLIGFCGNYVNRKPLLDTLQKEINLHTDIFVIGDDMVEAINSYHIHFNANIANDINYRSFETIGCGTMLMTNYNKQYEKLGFKDFENCVFYHSMDDIINKYNYLKDNPEEIKKIADAGYELSKKHTYKKRLKEVLDLLKLNT